jgi:hypothetical protein
VQVRKSAFRRMWRFLRSWVVGIIGSERSILNLAHRW